MIFYDDLPTPHELSDGGFAPTSKISRHPALGDKPGHSTGFTLWLADGDMLMSSAHPHSTLILHGQGPVRGKSHGR